MLCLPLLAKAQEGFDQELDFKQIQALLKEGIDERNLRKQALAWYKWALYDEEKAGLPDSAFQYLARSAKRFEQAGDTLAHFRALADLADRMAARGRPEEAIKMQQEALEYSIRTHNLYLETHLLVRLNRLYLLQGDTAQAMSYEKKFIAKNRILKDTLLEIKVLMEDAGRLQREYRYRDARYRAYRALQMATQAQLNEAITWAQFTIGVTSRLDLDLENALKYLRKAEQSNPPNHDAMRRAIYYHLAQTYSALDSVRPAHHYAIRYGELGDTLLNRDRAVSLQRLAMLYDDRQKREEIAALEAEKGMTQEKLEERGFTAAALAVGLCAVLLAMFFIVRDYRHRLHTNRVIGTQNEELNRRRIKELENTVKIEGMQSMLAGQESERQRIAQDLHDSVGGLLSAAKFQVEGLADSNGCEGLAKLRNLLDDTVSEIRHIARNMQPSALMEFGLVVALRDLTGRVRGQHSPTIAFQHIGDFEGLDETVALNCYRIVQELLQNSLKHAQASEILVQINHTDQQIALLVEDDGKGFDPETMKKGMGTDNIARRVQFLKGELSIHTAPGEGTSTLATIPVSPTER
ncbi:MAG TPA: sensor histidine kinase [Saprospiraceae bacterium]|nr:sensor histidine kinase [Saprospiraceae bacterium]